jgi:hypothetical protein
MTTNPQTIIRPSPKISFLNAREIWRYRELLYMLAARDIDLCVVEDALPDKHAEAVRLRRALSPLRIPVDVVVHSARAVQEWGEVSGTLINNILREGKGLYEKQ